MSKLSDTKETLSLYDKWRDARHRDDEPAGLADYLDHLSAIEREHRLEELEGAIEQIRDILKSDMSDVAAIDDIGAIIRTITDTNPISTEEPTA